MGEEEEGSRYRINHRLEEEEDRLLVGEEGELVRRNHRIICGMDDGEVPLEWYVELESYRSE